MPIRGYHYRVYAIALVAWCAGCSTPKFAEPVGGSRADGTITLAYTVSMFQSPVVDWAQADASATQRCSGWGYAGAERFGSGRNRCNRVNGYGNCIETVVLIDYQCTGAPSQAR